MAIGPVQMLVLGFNHPDFRGEIIDAPQRLQDSGTVRVIDSLAVFKDADGELEVEHLSNLPDDEAQELGRVVAALIGLGLGVDGEEGLELAVAGADVTSGAIDLFSEEEEGWDVLQDIRRTPPPLWC